MVDDGWIWGRGALDDKSGVIAQIEAVTYLIKQGFHPSRTIYFSFGHDEELGGDVGAEGVAKHLASQGVQLAWSLDEGGFLMDGLFPGVDVPVATINVAEKGFMSVEIIATAEGGHSSAPPKETAVGILAQAIVNLQKVPLAGGIDGLAVEMYDQLSRYMPFEQRMMFANQWLFSSILDKILSNQASSNAMLRTTTAPTMLSGSIKDNVLPIKAIAVVNFRLHPRDSVEGVVDHIREAVDDDRITLNVMTGSSASSVSSTTSVGFNTIAATAKDVFGNVLIAPGLLIAATDSRHYAKVADDAYRFNPIVVNQEVMGTFHGTNERISIDSIVQAATYYAKLMMRAAGTSPN